MQFLYENDNYAPKQVEQIFEGNMDHNSIVKNILPYSVTSDILRVIPVTWQNDICLRLDVITGIKADCLTPIEPISIEQVSATKEDINYPSSYVFTSCWLGTELDDQPFENWLQLELYQDYLITAVNFDWIEYEAKSGYETKAYRISYKSNTQEEWHLYIDQDANQNITTYDYLELDHPFTANTLRISLGFGCLRINSISGFAIKGVQPPNYCEGSVEMEDQFLSIYDDCPFPIGLESVKVKENQLTASSSIDVYHSPNSGRLNHLYGWQAEFNNQEQWFQIQFDQRVIMTGLLLQASDNCNLRRFALQFSYPSVDNNEMMFYDYKNMMNSIQEFMASDSVNCTERVPLIPYIRANYLKVLPLEWDNCIGLRMEVLGCNDKG
ncbi:EGF-like repeat and discoidin I-like domain-containing protein 3 [Antedon mediterranea]|uniref:EGF-like repeat and discoidin I-like domain-containing protein 3 n=1 Tax=Antedon mediterranea TaxID=105859 RepID=UPI003AF6D252